MAIKCCRDNDPRVIREEFINVLNSRCIHWCTRCGSPGIRRGKNPDPNQPGRQCTVRQRPSGNSEHSMKTRVRGACSMTRPHPPRRVRVFVRPARRPPPSTARPGRPPTELALASTPSFSAAVPPLPPPTAAVIAPPPPCHTGRLGGHP